MPEQFTKYLETVAEQIRWKRARPALTRELRTHLLTQMDDCLAQGMDQEAAEAEALRQMGDAAEVGRELDSVHRPAPQSKLLLLICLLALAGGILRIVLVTDIPISSSGLPIHQNHSMIYTVIKTATHVLLGFACLLLGYFLDYTLLGRYAKHLYFFAVAVGLFLLKFSPYANGTSYYTRYIVMVFPMVYALLIYSLRNRGWPGVFLAILGGVPLAWIAAATPYAMGLLILLVSGTVLLLIAAGKEWFAVSGRKAVVLIAGMATTGATAAWINYHWWFYSRLQSAFHPELDPLNTGYQGMTIRAALEGAKWWGEGTLDGALLYKDYWLSMPGSMTDSFLVTIIFQIGWLPFILLCAALCALLVWVCSKALCQKNLLSQLLCVSVILILGLQMTFSLMLTFGFVLFGASCPLLNMDFQTVIAMAMLGVVLSAFRQERIPFVFETVQRRPKGRWRLVYEPADT